MKSLSFKISQVLIRQKIIYNQLISFYIHGVSHVSRFQKNQNIRINIIGVSSKGQIVVGITDLIRLYIGSRTLQTNAGLLIHASDNQDNITSKKTK